MEEMDATGDNSRSGFGVAANEAKFVVSAIVGRISGAKLLIDEAPSGYLPDDGSFLLGFRFVKLLYSFL